MELPFSLKSHIIKRGTILHYTGFKNIDHGKFFVVLGIFENRIAGFSFINSNINWRVVKNQELLELQYPMRPCDYPFLKHLSFLCASDIEQYEVSELIDHYENGKIRIISKMLPQHLHEILDVCKKSRLIRNADKKRFLY